MSSTNHMLSICLLFSVIIAIVMTQNVTFETCTSKQICSECIQSPSCLWCSDPEYQKSRCLQISQANAEDCKEEFIDNPNNILSIVSNISLTKDRVSDNGAGSQRVQLTPQKLGLKLRAGHSYSIDLKFAQVDTHPVDLYYLMDFSSSMRDDKEKLIAVSDELVEKMKQLTSNFRLGFGSFVDKVVMPYVNTLPENLLHPCSGCAAPYGFKHAMKLSGDTSQFAHTIRNTNISGNLDHPEGGLDAIVQVAECQDQIGWRNVARKLLVFSTDASFHVAGDGKLGGIFQPNDGLCHLSSDGLYTESSFQDYPSIEQVNAILKKNRINIIFAVSSNVLKIYQELAEIIEGAKVGVLKEDSSNIVDLVQEQYNQISSKVEIKHNASRDVNLKFYSRCSNADGDLVNTNTCDRVKSGDTIEFRIDIDIPQCPKNPADHFQTIQIYPVGIEESLIIDLEMLCECDCEKPTSKWYEERSPKCHSHGTYKCGECYCDSESFGRNCECLDQGRYPWENRVDCAISSGYPECSGRGQCICGHCNCDRRPSDDQNTYGKYCECDNFSCERRDGKLCSGHGTCDCGQCACKPGWMGSDCACSTNTTTCYSRGDVLGDVICSGRGQCVCGQCECDTTEEGSYTGEFCEKRPARFPRQASQHIYPREIVLFRTASVFARVTQPTQLENCSDFNIMSEITRNEKIFAITNSEGIIYVDQFQGLKHSPEYVNLNVSWTRNNHREFDEIQVRIINEPNKTCGDMTDLSNWTFCSKYETSNDIPTYNYTTDGFLNIANCDAICILSVVGGIFLGSAIAIGITCWSLDRVNNAVGEKNNEQHHEMVVPL